jgi:acetyl-CoA carboxylase carboxyltransferase component
MWLKGMPVGVVASNANGIIYTESAQKATEWMIRCGNSKLPVIFLQGSPGYMVAKQEECAGYGMCGRAFKPVFCFTTMRGRTTVMSGKTAGFVMESLRRKNMADSGQTADEEELAKFRRMMIERYDAEGHPFLTGSLLFHDGIVAFGEIREKLARALELCYRVPIAKSDWGDLKV